MKVSAYYQSGESVQIELFDDNGNPVPIRKVVSDDKISPVLKKDGLSLPLTGQWVYGYSLPCMQYNLPSFPNPVQKLGCGEGVFFHIGNSWNAGPATPPSYSGRPFTGSIEGDCLVWALPGVTKGDYLVSIAYGADPSNSKTAQLITYDDSNHQTIFIIDQTVPPSDFEEDGVSWKTLGTITTHNLVNDLSIKFLVSQGKCNIDAFRISCTGNDVSYTINPSDKATLDIPDQCVFTDSGPISAISGIILTDRSVNTIPVTPKNMVVGYNIEGDDRYSPIITTTNISRRAQYSKEVGVVATDENGFPTLISAPVIFNIPVSSPPGDSFGKGKGWKNTINGKWTIRTTPKDTTKPVADLGLMHGVNSTSGNPDSTVVDPDTGISTKIYDIRSIEAVQYAPEITMAIVSGQPANSDGFFPTNIGKIEIFPPYPSDETGNTPYVNPPKYYPDYLYMIDGCKFIRSLDRLGTNDNVVEKFSDFGSYRPVNVGVVSIKQVVADDPWFDPKHDVILEVTLSEPVQLYDYANIRITNCGVANISNGMTVDLNSIIGVGHVVSPTVIWFQASTSDWWTPLDRKMTNVLTPTGGRLTSAIGCGTTIQYLIDEANQTKSSVWFTIPITATTKCVEDIAVAFADVKNGLLPELKIGLEESNECWNSSFFTNWSACALSYRYQIDNKIPNPSKLDYTFGYVAKMKKDQDTFINKWKSLGRNPNDVLRIVSTQGGKPGGVTNALLIQLVNQKVPVDLLAVGANFESVVYDNPTIEPTLEEQYKAMTPGQCLDWMRLLIKYGGFQKQFFTDHMNYINQYKATAQNAGDLDTVKRLSHIKLAAYEGGFENILPNQTPYNAFYRSQAMVAHPNMYWAQLELLQSVEDVGCVIFCDFNLGGGYFGDGQGRLAVWGMYIACDQKDGTGDMIKDKFNFTNPLDVDKTLCERGGAIKYYNSLASPVTPTPIPDPDPVPDPDPTPPPPPPKVNYSVKLDNTILFEGSCDPSDFLSQMVAQMFLNFTFTSTPKLKEIHINSSDVVLHHG